MGRKSSSKTRESRPGATPDPKRPFPALLVAAVGALAVTIGGFVYWQQRDPAVQDAAVQTPQLAPIPADLKPHPQANLPPLDFPGYPMQRPTEVVRAAYKFAAEHPEILSYVPCFCGCERSGHRGNEDCFVRARDINGDVIEWEPHGMECAVCLDVAERSERLYASGASVSDIRATIEREWQGKSTNHTPTPHAPSK